MKESLRVESISAYGKQEEEVILQKGERMVTKTKKKGEGERFAKKWW